MTARRDFGDGESASADAAKRRPGMVANTPSSATHRVRRAYERKAKGYDREMAFWDRVFGDPEGRAWACSGLHGRVLELAVGTGLNLPHYGKGVELTGVDLSPAMLEQARARAERLGLSVELLEGDVTRLPFPDHQFDAVVCTLALCAIPDQVAAVREAMRVCKPGGELRFFDHGIASNRLVALAERLIEPLVKRIQAGERLTLHPVSVLRDAGAEVVAVQRRRAGVYWRVLARPPALV